ncbi:beta-lactamase family protein [Nocardia uniformis]|uniref:Beta-lactamase family protein n=1 Tax=Nocardia uniformis TaxID=53432 RepID=A0A849CF35_9NOCA|nr:serine hydrolase domain-containing protein [Nocardia uniformis]NNH74099.1 beta-lactamase family protein [Nocardia uniformis]
MPGASTGESLEGMSSGQMLVDDRFTAVAAKFFSIFRRPRAGGGALAVYLDGEPVLDIWAGWADTDRRWRADTMALSYSTSKGVAATVINRLADRGVLDYDTPVAEYWSEFAANGKADITLRDVLRHRAGLQRMRDLLDDPEDLLDHDKVAAALAEAAPDPMRHRASGYHGLNFGTLVAEIAQRATGRSFTDLVRTELAEPLGDNDFWFGVPENQRYRIARLSPRLSVGKVPFDRLVGFGSRLRALDSARSAIYDGWVDMSVGDKPYDAMMPGWNGTFTARALGKMYGALANDGMLANRRLLRPETTNLIAQMPPNSRYDYVLGGPPHFNLGYHRAIVGATLTRKAFGHFGIGGSGGIAIPGQRVGIGFVTNRLGYPAMTLGDTRLPFLAAMIQRAARAARVESAPTSLPRAAAS